MFLYLCVLLASSQASTLGFARMEPHLFESIMAEATEAGTQKNIDDINTLIAVGEHERAIAIKNQSLAQADYDKNLKIWQDALAAEQKAIGIQKAAERAEVQATTARDNAITFRDTRIAEKKTADDAVPPALKFKNDEKVRVDAEHATLNKVTKILNGILPSNLLEVPSPKLLSRTTTLLSNPMFLEQLSKANPDAVKKVIDLVADLIAKGTAEVEAANKAYDDRVSEAKTAAQNLVDAEAALAKREAELVDATADREAKTKIAQQKSQVERERRAIRDAFKLRLDIQIAFTAREIVRIDKEKLILETGRDQEKKLKQVVIALQDPHA